MLTFLNLPQKKSLSQYVSVIILLPIRIAYSFFQLLTHFQNFASFFFKTLHTNPRIAHTKCKIPHMSYKVKHCIQNITNTSQKQAFVLRCKHLCHNIIFFGYIIHTVIQNLKQFFHELLCIFLYKFECYWHRDVEKNHSNH